MVASPRLGCVPRIVHWQSLIIPFISSKVKTGLSPTRPVSLDLHSFNCHPSFPSRHHFYDVIPNVKGCPLIPNCWWNLTLLPQCCAWINSRHHRTQILTSAMTLSFGPWQASTITNTLLTTVTGQDNSPEYKIIGRKRDQVNNITKYTQLKIEWQSSHWLKIFAEQYMHDHWAET